MPGMLASAWDRVCRLSPLYFDWIQVDPSTRVITASPLHPAARYGNAWMGQDLPFSVFTRLEPVLERTRNVFLHGWGDPFANPSFFTMVRICKEHRCTVSTATRGRLLEAADCDHIVAAGIDQISFPIDALDDATSRERTGFSLDQTVAVIRMLQEAKRRVNSALPVIDVRYTLTRSRLDEVYGLPTFLESLGIESAIVTTPAFVPSAEMADECLVPRRPEQLRWLISHLDRLFARGLDHGVVIRYFVLSPGKKRLTCIENVTESLFLGADGRISPCAAGQLPVRGDVAQWYLGKETPYQPIVFGSLAESELAEIWHSKAYRKFRQPFYWNRLSQRCEHCLTPFRVYG
ncbi:radical SAM/SPASM domain-containing protein [Oceanidesulfovibrio marinus]|uniref:4Fe4S-binding SPASM domain-containing protein n=1 Tax=Oceanidesulfovibrio marinus TaxID=370038 RepID=A0ABX6NBR6_9BACT|nr:radical SAM protein [Oceanidesulfovibrio marinus]QJT08038.1 hypothetical protein E8L03_03460 [Oceanidesulfovibrio marinus]